ncbi:MAG: hypothetical protein JSR37_04455 [Verrucomicrobia bacterium]|nr:hypothetical protein [Verrucomicrobiota bacterium]MBS0638028.1 hypothetical protein [Verrucomicrobiota bacterium]
MIRPADESPEQFDVRPEKRTKKDAPVNKKVAAAAARIPKAKAETAHQPKLSKKRERQEEEVPLHEKMSRLSLQGYKKEAAEAAFRAADSVAELPLSAETLPIIFKLENDFRTILSQPTFPHKEKLQHQYNSVVLPLLDSAKNFIRHHPKSTAAQAAASKGKAFVLGKSALESAKEKNITLEANVDSAQEVILLPEDNTVLKRMGAKAKEESYLADSLFELMSTQAVVGSFDIKQANYEAKPFVQMTLIGELQEEAPAALDLIMQRLTPEAECNAILTGEIQLLDLHYKNLAVAPVIPAACEKYVEFRLGPDFDEPIPLKDFLIKHLNGELDQTQPIQFVERATRRGKETEVLVQTTFKELPREVKSALDCPWQFVIFDTDASIGEDNRLQNLVEEDQIKTLIPLRSVLLELDWKDRPLSEQAIERFIHSDAYDAQVDNWIRRNDAPIYQQISQEARARVEEITTPRIAQYDLSSIRRAEENEYITVSDLRGRFVESLCEVQSRDSRALWRVIESELQYDFKSRAVGAITGRYVIARQLFPRLTVRQQEALRERQANRKEYLHNYMQLLHAPATTRTELERFINQPTTPLSSARRKELLASLRNRNLQALTGISSPLAIKEAILNETRPTYFNLMKSMYPLLADAYALTEAVKGKAEAGENIGCFDCSLESIIEEVKERFSHDLSLMNMAEHLEEQIASIKNPSFFGFMAPSDASDD